MKDETIEDWLDDQIKDSENLCGHLRSYRRDTSSAVARLQAFKETRQKLQELWGVGDHKQGAQK